MGKRATLEITLKTPDDTYNLTVVSPGFKPSGAY